MLKLSLVAQFDDLVRNSAVLTTGIEQEFLRTVNNQEKCRKRCFEELLDLQSDKEKIKELVSENGVLQTKLRHARISIDEEIKKRRRIEEDRDTLERQIQIVREIILTDKTGNSFINEKDREKLAILSNTWVPSTADSPQRNNLSCIEESISLLDDGDYDKTGDDIDNSFLRNGKAWHRVSSAVDLDKSPPGKRRRSKSRDKLEKNHRRSRSANAAVRSVLKENNSEVDPIVRIPSPNRNVKKYHSTSQLHENKENNSPNGFQSSTPEQTSPFGLRRHDSGLNRPHNFCLQTFVKLETCSHCSKRIGFGRDAMKCRDCKVSSHKDCSSFIPLPCVPSTVTPGPAPHMGLLEEFAPKEPPMIPALLIYCANEVEARGLSEPGLYRVSGSEREYKDLKERFLKGRGIPNLSNVDDIHVVTGCLKLFLRDLKEPLLTYRLWNNFVNAANESDADEKTLQLYQAISQLPKPNQHTLAFLILHLQRVSQSPATKMDVMNLSRIFGPTMVGYSTSDPSDMEKMNETGKQIKLLESLMNLCSDYYSNFICTEPDATIPMDCLTPQTPEARPVPDSTLGPLSPYVNDADKTRWYNTPIFSTSANRQAPRRKFFNNSPMNY